PRAGRARRALHGLERTRRGRRPARAGPRALLASGADGVPPYTEKAMIYCVIPRELEGELFDRMVEYYKDNPNVTVIVDRRDGPARRSRGTPGGKREIRDRRRAPIPGTFPEPEAP